MPKQDPKRNAGQSPGKSNPKVKGKPETGRTTPVELKTQASRPQGAGVVKRGDRRDMHPLYSTGKNRAKPGQRPPAADRTRKR